MKGFCIFLLLLIATITGVIYFKKYNEEEAINEKCCVSCSKSGQVKVYSIDTKYDNCGEGCLNPKLFWVYKIFESGLTLAEDKTCKDLGYSEYEETVTHGVYPLKITIDLYKKK